ncbi:MAG: T9SS type A sorting domain-containing protein [Flavobacteriales bacterium]|nr:T9SS type A sorting domain-containing protein [Flavobacteriales bacterium]
MPTGASTLVSAANHTTWFSNVGDTRTFPTTFNNQFHRVYFLQGARYLISLCGAPMNTVLYVNNNGLLNYACDDDGCGPVGGASQIIYTHEALSGLGRLYAYEGACNTPLTSAISLTITRIAPLPPPPNDDPCDITLAQQLPMGTTCSFIVGNSIGATLTPGYVTGICGAEPSLIQNDIWFSTTVPASGLIGITTEESGSLCAGGFALYSGACSGLTLLPNSCTLGAPTGPNQDPASVYDAFAAGLPVGATVYIRYWERQGNENGTFSICAYEAQRPVNDNPCGAIDLPVNVGCSFTSYSNANATNLSGPTAGAPGCGTAPNNDLWFAVTVTPAMVTNGITINTTAGTQNNWDMAWYRLTGPCGSGSLTAIACNANQSGSNPMPRINSVPGVPLVNGETIYIRVWNTAPWEGTFGICATLNQPPPNDDPCGAIPLTVNFGCILSNGSNESATNTISPFPNGSFATGATPTCQASFFNDVWYSVVMPPNGVIQIDTQLGTLINGGAALYSATGSCGGGNLTLTQVACANNGSQQGPTSSNMPYLNYSNAGLAGQTLYVRVWRQGPANPNGNFGICARRTDPPPTNCFYTLTLNDSGGDGWQGSFVTVCVAGVCNNYTVNGANASINIGTNIGQLITISYTAVGGFQNQNSFTLTQFGQPVYISGTSPTNGFHFGEVADCEPPPAPQSDCLGAVTLCSQNIQVNQNPTNTGGVVDLNASNRGCLSANERQGLWYTFSTLCAGNVAFSIVPTGGADYDFAVWGPLTGLTCPPPGPPIRCSWAAPSFSGAPTGLAINGALPTSEGSFGSGFVRHLTVAPGDVYLLYIDNYSMNGVQFDLNWAGGNGTCPPHPIDNPDGSIVGCIVLPVDLAEFDAQAYLRHVDLHWKTVNERNSDHFEVQRSADGMQFAPVGRVAAAGESQQTINYNLIDEDPIMGMNYYRLKQQDKDGAFSYSDIVAVQFKPGPGVLEVYPNPTDDRLRVVFESYSEQAMRWRVTDASGRRVLEGNEAAMPGRNRIDLGVQQLEPGSYILELVAPDGSTHGTARFMKQ